MDRWVTKANAYAAGWLKQFGVYPSFSNVVVGLSVAQHETRCGDAWPGENNWGACQKRSLSTAERAILSSTVGEADPHRVAAAIQAFATAIATGTFVPPADWANCGLHVDSTPIGGHQTWYWVFFWKFDQEADGASFFIHVLAGQRPGCRVILESPETDQAPGTNTPVNYCLRARLVAAQMYATHYYEGFHDPHQPGGAQANINDYGNSLCALTPSIALALTTAAWTPGVNGDPEPVNPIHDFSDLDKVTDPGDLPPAVA